MINDNGFSIIYKHYIPDDWIIEFEDGITKNGLTVGKYKDEDKYYNFEGPELADIIVYIKDNPTSIFIAPAAYDIAKYGVISLWKKLRGLNVKVIKQQSAEPKRKKLSIQYEDADGRKLNINLEGDISDDLIEEVVEESFDMIKSDKKEKFYTNKDYVNDNNDNPTVELNYNENSKQLEPKNHDEIRKFIKGLEDEIDKLS